MPVSAGYSRYALLLTVVFLVHNIYLAAGGPRALELAGRIADGVYPASVTNFRREGVEAPSCLVARTGRRCWRT